MAPLPKMTPAPEGAGEASFDRSAVEEHCARLHELARGHNGVLVVSVFHASPVGQTDAPGIVTHHPVGEVEGMISAVMAHDGVPGANTYVGLQVMRKGIERGRRGTENDIVAVLGLVADMDSDTGKAAGTLPAEPSYVVETSPGNEQPAWIFDRALTVAEAKPLAASLRAVTKSDHGTADVTHVWRIPGTLNWPNRKKIERGRALEPAQVRLSKPFDGTMMDATAFRSALPAAATAAHTPVAIGELPELAGIELSEEARELLAASDVGDRSAHAARVVERLSFDGLSAEEAATAFLAATGDWFERYRGEAHALTDFRRLFGKDKARREQERQSYSASASRLAASARVPATPAAANDNRPDASALDIFEWRSGRFMGEPEPVEYLVDGVVERGIPGMVGAMGEVGKSYALLELKRRIAFGTSKLAAPIFGGHVVQEGTAVFISGEDDARAIHRRLAAIDPKGARYSEKGDKLIVVPIPSTPGGIRPYWREDRKKGLVETDDWLRLCDQLSSIPDLRSVAIDPLQLLAHVPLNEDPAAGQFVCGSIATLAVRASANVFFAHHMKKASERKAITTLADARESIRGTTAIVDGVRVAYALWYPEKESALKICKEIGVTYEPNRIVHGGVVKANGAARRILSTYSRNEFGLIVDVTAKLQGQIAPQDDLRVALVIAIEQAADSGRPFKHTGTAGLYANRERLPDELRKMPRHRLEELATTALDRGEVLKASAKGEKTAQWLDVPTGMFARGLGMFSAGADRR